MRIALYASERDNSPRPADVTWAELVELLTQHAAAPCTLATCPGKTCPHKYGRAWSPVDLAGGTRANANVIGLTAAVFDLDDVLDEAWADELIAAGVSCVVHSSHTHRTGAPRLRVVLELDRPVLAAEWPRVWRGLIARFGLPVDPQCKDLSRLYFLPSCPSDAPRVALVQAGRAVDVDTVLGETEPDVELEKPPTAPLETDQPPASAGLLAEVLRHLERIGPAIEGQGGDAKTYQAAAIARHAYALSEDEAFEVLSMWNRNCRPPWSEPELRQKITNAAAYAQGDFGESRARFEGDAAVLAALSKPTSSALIEPPEPVELTPWQAELARARADIAAALASQDDSGATVKLFRSVADLFSCEYPDTLWLVESLIAEGGTTMIAGEPKTGIKSWSLVEIATAIATGTLAFGKYRTGVPKRVAYFFAEDLKRSVRNRFRASFAARKIDPTDAADRLFVEPRGRFLDVLNDEDLAIIVASVRDLGGVEFLVLEPLRDLHSGEENDSDGMAPVMKRLRVLGTVLRCTIGVAHHTKKGNEGGGGRNIRGSSAIHGSIDSGFYVSDPAGDGQTTFVNTIKSEVKAARGAGTFELTLKVTDDAGGEAVLAEWTVATRAEKQKAALSELEQTVIATATDAPDQTMTGLSKLVGGNNTANLKAIRKLVADGELLLNADDASGKNGAIRQQHPRIAGPRMLREIDLGFDT